MEPFVSRSLTNNMGGFMRMKWSHSKKPMSLCPWPCFGSGASWQALPWPPPRGEWSQAALRPSARSGSVTNINQSTNKASINWQTFSIAPAETVNFNQPSIYSITLNRVVGNESSLIPGALNATGRVYLINSNGILFTKGSSEIPQAS